MTIALKSNISGTSGAIQINGTDAATVDANGNLTATGTISGSSAFSFRNKIINGNFDIWQRAVSQTATGYGSDDRWNNVHVGSTKTASRQAFTLGQTAVPNNPQFFSRTVVTSVANAANYVVKQHRIEDVTLSSDKTMTLSFWAKADANKNIAVEFIQQFGTGGSPSAQIDAIGVTTFALTTSWQKFTTTVTFPSVSGKTLGSNNDDITIAQFWFDAGSSFNSKTNSLGQQSGTFDIAQVQLEEGTIATPFETRPFGVELQMCKRYCQIVPTGTNMLTGVYRTTTQLENNLYVLDGELRSSPTITVSSLIGSVVYVNGTSTTISTILSAVIMNSRFLHINVTTPIQPQNAGAFILTNSTIQISAEI